MKEVTIHVNGVSRTLAVDPRTSLLDLLRERLGLTGGLALMLEDSAQHTVLPIGRRGQARASLEGTIAHQIEAAEREAGVRRQL